MTRMLSLFCVFTLLFSVVNLNTQIGFKGLEYGAKQTASVEKMAAIGQVEPNDKDCCSKHLKTAGKTGKDCTASCLAIPSNYQVLFESGIAQPVLLPNTTANEIHLKLPKRPPRIVL